jgi:L-threonylcarbamoyladenylate synthase
VAFPTETVYGLGGDARNDDALRRIYAAKDRPAGNPVIVHVADVPAARKCVRTWPPAAAVLAERFWPGPLTLVLPRAAGISPLVSAGRDTVAVRCPHHAVAEALLRTFDGPVAAPSANRAGFVSPTTADHVRAELGGRIPLIIDDGPCSVGVESTVVDLSGERPTILRPGAVTREMLQGAFRAAGLPDEVQVVADVVAEDESALSPGQHLRHYAPQTPAYRFRRGDWQRARAWAAEQADSRRGGIVLLTYDDDVALAAPHETVLLPADAAGYARVLYAALRAADQRAASAIAVLLPASAEGLWAAVHDRLRRATQVLRPAE